MASKQLVVGIFILLLVLGGFYVWYVYEKPQQQKINDEMVNLSVYATDNTGRLIHTGFEVFQNQKLFKIGKTLTSAPILIQVNRNNFIEVKNKNINFQNYYIYDWNNSLTKKENVSRVELKLVEPSKLKVKLLSNLGKEGNLNFSLQTNNIFKNLILCETWSLNFIYVKSNYTLIGIPKNYQDYYRCYDTKITIKKNEIKYLNLKYKVWGNLDKKDFIKFAFIDKDNNMTELNKTDVFAKDGEYLLNYKGVLK